MSQTKQDSQPVKETGKTHKLQVRNKPGTEGHISKGAITEVLLDGKPLKGVSFFKFEVKAGGVAKVMLEMYADVDVEIATELTHKELKSTGYETQLADGRKAVGLYELGNYSPKQIATTKVESGCSSAGSKPYCDSCACGKKEAFEKKNK